MSENDIAKIVVDVCFKIHTMYGPGLFESVYEKIFCYEWEKKISLIPGNAELRSFMKEMIWA